MMAPHLFPMLFLRAHAEEIAALNHKYQSCSSGFGALQEDPMEFHTEREEALYTTLKQVLQNHVSNHRIGYHETLSACVSVLGYVLYVMSDGWDEAPTLIESTVAELKQRTHERRSRA